MKQLPNRRLIKAEIPSVERIPRRLNKTDVSILNYDDHDLIDESEFYLKEDESPFAAGAIATAIGQIFNTLPQLGVGRRKRQKEAQTLSDIEINEANKMYGLKSEYEEKQTEQLQKIIFISGILIFIIVVVLVALRK